MSEVGTRACSHLKSRIIRFYESESKSDEEIESLIGGLKLLIDDIWENGLEPDYLDCLISIFCSVEPLDNDCRCLILECLVPQVKVSASSSKKMVLFVLTKSIQLGEASSRVLWWLRIMLRHNLVDGDSVASFFNMLIKWLVYPYLVKQLCALLCQLLKPRFVTESNCKLLERYYKEHCSHPHIGRLLWEFAQYAPHLVSKKFHFTKPAVWDHEEASKFERVIRLQASRFTEDRPKRASSQKVSIGVPVPEYAEVRKDVEVKRISDVKSMFELGRAFEKLQLPRNEVSLMQSEEGIMYMVVNGPSPAFLCSLNAELCKLKMRGLKDADNLIMSVSGLQELLSYGLPPVTVFLSDFLTTWDGNYKEAYVYSLLPRVHFNTFSDLKEQILVPLTRVFVTESAETKVKILDSLLLLITHVATLKFTGGVRQCDSFPRPKWTEDIESTAYRLIHYVHNLWLHGVTLEGQECTHLVLHGVLFYQHINTLIIKCQFLMFWVIHPCLSSPALLSKNHVVLDELCSLILSYKKDIIPTLENDGVLDEFEGELEALVALADSTYKYLWNDLPYGMHINFQSSVDEYTPNTCIGLKHMALYPIVCTLSKQLNRDPDSMNRSEIMTLLSTFMKGVADFISNEEIEQLI